MKAKTKFMKMYHKLPDKAKRELIYEPYSTNAMSLGVCLLEVRKDTKLGKSILIGLGFEEVKSE